MSACEAIVVFLGIAVGPCGDVAEGLYRGGCEHEHVKDRYLCAFHASAPGSTCRECSELPGDAAHDCPVTIVRAAAGAQR